MWVWNQHESLFRTSLVIQWLGLCASRAGGVGSVPGQITRIPYAAWHSQEKRKEKEKKTINDHQITQYCLSPSAQQMAPTPDFIWGCVHVCVSRSIGCDSLWHYRLYPARLFSLWDFSGKNTRVGCHFPPWKDLSDPGSNPHLLSLLHCRQIFYLLHHQGSPFAVEM